MRSSPHDAGSIFRYVGPLGLVTPMIWLIEIPARALPWTFITLYGMAFFAYALCLFTQAKGGRYSLATILVMALLLRFIGLAIAPELSDDLYRYLWEGKIGLAGWNPYRYPPSAPEFDALSDAIRSKVNHGYIPSVYPPVAQAIFRLLVSLHYGPLSMKIFSMVCDIGICIVLISILRQLHRSPSWVIVYAWNPLPILEFAGNAHLDSAALLCLLLAARLHIQSQPRVFWRDVLLGVAMLIKVFPIAMYPIFLAETARRQGIRAVGGTLLTLFLVALVAYLPFLADWSYLEGGMRHYGHRWSFNASLWALLELLLGKDYARATVICVFAGVMISQILWKPPLLRALYYVSGAFFLLSPTAHPWYLCWTLPYLCIWPHPAWILLSGTVVLAYSVFGGAGGWSENPSWVWLEYSGFYLLLFGIGVYRIFTAPVSKPVDNYEKAS